MTPAQLVREYFPDADDDDVENILWNYTGFPGFWSDENLTPEENLRIDLQHLQDVGFEQVDTEMERATNYASVTQGTELTAPIGQVASSNLAGGTA